MEIIPAIDLKNGKCVRLYQGDYSKETVFSDDPVATALKWQEKGARWLHLVDLDGAAAGEVRNSDAIRNIVKNTQQPAGFPEAFLNARHVLPTMKFLSPG